jgi:hypothetical protein
LMGSTWWSKLSFPLVLLYATKMQTSKSPSGQWSYVLSTWSLHAAILLNHKHWPISWSSGQT